MMVFFILELCIAMPKMSLQDSFLTMDSSEFNECKSLYLITVKQKVLLCIHMKLTQFNYKKCFMEYVA
jgi:hypothetical protein